MSAAFFDRKSPIVPLGGIGKVKQAITSSKPGRIYYRATYWPARFSELYEPQTIIPGEQVRVVGRQGLTLLVVPESYA